jgi:hypothetical protein
MAAIRSRVLIMQKKLWKTHQQKGELISSLQNGMFS